MKHIFNNYRHMLLLMINKQITCKHNGQKLIYSFPAGIPDIFFNIYSVTSNIPLMRQHVPCIDIHCSTRCKLIIRSIMIPICVKISYISSWNPYVCSDVWSCCYTCTNTLHTSITFNKHFSNVIVIEQILFDCLSMLLFCRIQ